MELPILTRGPNVPLKCWTGVQHLHLCNLILWLQWLFYQLIYAFAFCFNFEAGINEGWHLKTKKKHLEMRFLELYGCSDQQGLRGLPASAHSQVQRWSQKTNKGGCRQQAASMTHWATEGIPFFSRSIHFERSSAKIHMPANSPELQAIAVKDLTLASGSTFPDYPYHSLCGIFARIPSHNLRKKGDKKQCTL